MTWPGTKWHRTLRSEVMEPGGHQLGVQDRRFVGLKGVGWVWIYCTWICMFMRIYVDF